MSKRILSVVVGLTVCFSMAAGAQSSVQVGKDGSVKVQSGGSKVDVGGGRVNVQTDDDESSTPASERAADEATQDSSGSEVEITGSGRKETLSCSGTTEVSISGSSNELTITGDCKSVEVTGSTNKVTLEGVGRIDVTGSSNTVTWKRAVGKAKKPKVSATGIGNKVSKAP
ncbi:DUF3060 domain-containing protein [Hyalangium versicolor]|uniref:DUF3060 domain-containing protein n=1 Tax=Hyalangium versicolor TaxID=2861190 RepID=UPI001CCD041D|nr:DUF3060 domain-containing protein [Hyalangium versicolor]